MFWIFLVFCVIFVLGGFVGYYLREATGEEHGDSASDGPRQTDHFAGRKNPLRLDPETTLTVHENIMYDITGDSIAKNLRHLPDYANTMSGGEWDKLSALKVKVILEKLRFDHVKLHQHQVALSFPDPKNPNKIQRLNSDGKVIEEVSLVQKRDNIQGGGGNVTDKIPEHDHYPDPYVAYSGTGSVKGPLVYGHYGRVQDMAALLRRKINTTNAVFLVRLGEIPVEDKIAYVKEAGAKAVLFYWDPVDTFAKSTKSGYSHVPYASFDSQIIEEDHILAQTVSMETAEGLLRNQVGSEVPSSWNGGLNVTYRLGNKVDKPQVQLVQLTVNNKIEKKTIYNVVATIHGSTEPDRYVYIGAPRTSFPDVAMETKLSTAMLISTAQALYDSLTLTSVHWVPRRTIKLCSWGGTEFSDLGMKLYLKERKNVLLSRAVMYLDLGHPVRGNQTLKVTATPSLQALVYMAASRVPDAIRSKLTLFRAWSEWEKQSTGAASPPLSFYPTEDSTYPMFDTLGVSTISYQYAPSHNFQLMHLGSEEVTTLESQDTQHHYRFHVSIARVTVVTMLTLADSNFFSQFNMSDYRMYVFNRVNSMVHEIYLENGPNEISHHIGSLQEVALLFLVSQSYEMFTPAYLPNEDDLMVRMLNDRFLLLDRSLLVSLTKSNRKRHILSGSSTQDAFSTVGQYTEISRITGDWNRTILALESLTQVLTEATLTLRVGE